MPAAQQGVVILGVPIGSPDFVRQQLEDKSAEQDLLFQRIPLLEDTQACWLLLLMCAATRANFWLRAVCPEHTESFAARHDDHVWGGLSLMSAVRSRVAAHWSSWADCIHMIKQRHPEVAETLIMGIHRDPSPCFVAVRHCQGLLEGAGLDVPSWRSLANTPPVLDPEADPTEPKRGWQHRAARCLEERHLRRQVWPTLSDPARALVRSQQGPLASAALTALPTSRATRIDPQPFRVWLCRRLFLPLPLSSRTCRCGRLLDMYGHHRAACSRAGVLGCRGFREAGGRVGLDRFIRDLDVGAFNP